MDSKMDDDDYYVDHYDCPQQQQQLQQSTIISSTNQSISNSRKLSTNSTKTKASVSKMDDNDSIIEFVSANNTPSTPKSSDLISNTSSLKNDDEPYEYDDDYLDKFFSISSTPPPVAVATVATDTISTVSSDLIHDDKQQTTSDMNETTLYEKYLSDIWQQLNVGHDGYLTMDELYRVCEHIGMTIQSDQMIEQLFDKLDSDQDGRVSLAEFVDGLFKYLHDQPATTSPTNSVIESLCYNNQNNNQTIISNESSSLSSLDNDIEDYESNNINENVPLTSLNNKHFKLNHNFSHHYQRNNICNNNQSSPSSSSIQLSSALSIIYNQLASYSNFFTIKHDKDGYTDSGTLIDLWESFGFNNEENNDNIDDNSRLNIEDSINNDNNFNNQQNIDKINGKNSISHASSSLSSTSIFNINDDNHHQSTFESKINYPKNNIDHHHHHPHNHKQQKQQHQQQSKLIESYGENILKLFGYSIIPVNSINIDSNNNTNNDTATKITIKHQQPQKNNNLKNYRNYHINLQQLWTKMLYHVLSMPQQQLQQQQRDYDSLRLFQISLATILNEFSQLKIQNEQIISKCERLELQLEQANRRTEMLAQEIDEQHSRLEKASQTKLASLEKKYQEQLRLIEMDYLRENEMMIIQSYHMRQDIDKQMKDVQEQLAKFRANIKLLEEENKRLESDCQLMKCQNHELVKNFIDIQRHVEESDNLNAKIAELESIENAEDRKNLEQLTNEMKLLKEQNKLLQDQNDELLIEKESLRQQLAALFLASYQQQQSTNATSATIELPSSTATNQSINHSSSSSSSTKTSLPIEFKKSESIMSNTGKINVNDNKTLIESDKLLPIFGFSTSTNSIFLSLTSNNNAIRSKKRKRRRKRKKNKNKNNNNSNNDDNVHEINETNNNNNNNNYDKDDKHSVNVSKRLSKIYTDNNNCENVHIKTNDTTAKTSSLKHNNQMLSEDDRSSTFSTITTHYDDCDDDLDFDDDNYDNFCQHQNTLISAWTSQQQQQQQQHRRKRIKQPSSNYTLDNMNENNIENNCSNDIDDDDDDNENIDEEIEDDEDIDEDDNPQTLIQSTTYTRSLSDEINFDRSRPIYATTDFRSRNLKFKNDLESILNQILETNENNDENNNMKTNELLLVNAIERMQNTLKQIKQKHKNNTDKQIFDHNNNPDA